MRLVKVVKVAVASTWKLPSTPSVLTWGSETPMTTREVNPMTIRLRRRQPLRRPNRRQRLALRRLRLRAQHPRRPLHLLLLLLLGPRPLQPLDLLLYALLLTLLLRLGHELLQSSGLLSLFP